MRILISAGHTNNPASDRGAVGNGFIEGVETVKIRDRVADILRARGLEVIEDGADYSNGSELRDTSAPISTIITNTLGVIPEWERAGAPGDPNTDYNFNAPIGTFPVGATTINGIFGQNLDNSSWIPFLEFQDPGYLLTKYWKMGSQFGSGDGTQCALIVLLADGSSLCDLNGSVMIHIRVCPS